MTFHKHCKPCTGSGGSLLKKEFVGVPNDHRSHYLSVEVVIVKKNFFFEVLKVGFVYFTTFSGVVVPKLWYESNFGEPINF